VSYNPGGSFLAISTRDCLVSIWKVSDYQLLHVYSGSSIAVSLSWLPAREDTLMCGLEDGSITSLTITDSSLDVVGFWAHAFPVECLAAKGMSLASGAHEELFIWKLRDGISSGKWCAERDLGMPPTSSHNEAREVIVTSIHWTKSKRYSSLLLVTFLHHGFMVFDAKTWTRIRAFPLKGCIADADITADGRTMVISNMTTGFDLYDVESMSSMGTYKHDVAALRMVPVTFIHGGNAVVSGSTVGEAHLWDVETCCGIHTL
ncbi:WD40 repeat-like protein, partial [Trametes versicolor FP-101664 SS1]|uniref:WD40 repeat-like protein n=1 Tax=Trametes versicolor (strain FP-101664) TaxID=717944 RepID=UPI000462195F